MLSGLRDLDERSPPTPGETAKAVTAIEAGTETGIATVAAAIDVVVEIGVVLTWTISSVMRVTVMGTMLGTAARVEGVPPPGIWTT